MREAKTSGDGASVSDVAIVGMGCRYPGGISSPEEFWRALCRKQNSVTPVPLDRWDAEALFSPDPADPGKSYARFGAFVENVDQFDPDFFGISPREAAQMDPQQRLLLEVAHEAMEDAGVCWDDPEVRNTGVFIGIFIHDYQHMQFSERDALSAHSGTGTAMSIAANRISYVFDLHGPSVAVDTACSSSLVAVDMACRALKSGECDYALAGGVNLILKPEMTMAMSKATMLSVDGACKAFDSRANGYVRGEGAGLVLLRRSRDLRADAGRSYALIRGSGVNSDGRTKGISVPNGDAQACLSRRVLAEARVAAASVGYVEAHGTGTPVGDPIEAHALGQVFGSGRPGDDRCLLGSVKTNIGHLESASGIAGLMKAALCVQRGEVPPNLHFETPNPKIDLDALRLRVVAEQTKWPESLTPRRAAVNSFGFGGTNAHVLLEEAPAAFGERGDSRADAIPSFAVLPLSAHSKEALQARARQLLEKLDLADEPVGDLAYTLTQRRTHLSFRAALPFADRRDLRAGIAALAEGRLPVGGAIDERLGEVGAGLVFVFTGMGPQWWAMGRELLATSPEFRVEVERIDCAVRKLAGWSVIEELQAEESESRIQETQIAQPAIFAVQAGLVALWRALGVVPAACMGHSVGEVAALYTAGILDLDDAVTVSVHRSRLQKTTAGTGSMLAAGLSVAEAEERVQGREDRIGIAAINSPQGVSFSGCTEVLERLQAELMAEGRFARMLQVEVPYHSPQMDPIRDELLRSLRNVSPQAGSCVYYSTATGERAVGRAGDAGYWWKNVRGTVRFAGAVDAALEDGHRCFLEVGPHPVLRTSLQECMRAYGVAGRVVASLWRGRPERDCVVEALSELYVAGIEIDWARRFPRGQRIDLPCYPWQRSRHWSESKDAELRRRGLGTPTGLSAVGSSAPMLGVRLGVPEPTWVREVSLAKLPFVADHRVQGAVVFPGTGFLEMVLEALLERDACDLEAGASLAVSNVEIERALYLTDGAATRVQLELRSGRFEIRSCTGDAAGEGRDEPWLLHAHGRARTEERRHALRQLDLAGIRERCTRSWPADYAYRLFQDVGLEYGPTFQAIESLEYGPREALARLRMPDGLPSRDSREGASFVFHPALFDACLHTLFGALNLNGEDSHRRGNVYLPVSARQLRVHGRASDVLWSHARLVRQEPLSFEADIAIHDADGALVAEVLGLRCQGVHDALTLYENRKREWLFEYAWQPSPAAANGAPEERAAAPVDGWIVLAPSAGHALVGELEQAGYRVCALVANAATPLEDATLAVAPGAVEPLVAAIEQATSGDPCRWGVIHAWSLAEAPSGADWSAQLLGAASAMQLVQALIQRSQRSDDASKSEDRTPARLWFVTRNASPVLAGDPIHVEQSTLWGLRRVVANEHPQLEARIADLDSDPESIKGFVREIAVEIEEDELAWRAGDRYVHRLSRYHPERLDDAPSTRTSAGEHPVEARVLRAGDLRSMRWVECARLELAPDEVEIEVEATGLNFKDVMKATGLFPTRLVEASLWSRERLGMECAGRVSRVGSRVTHVHPGDAVMALAPRSFASHAVTHAELVVLNPGLTAQAAAGVPVAFLTASVGLEHLARLKPGERVLVHAASGGVGQAAIQIAQLIGAEVFATAGSESKRELVRALGVKHVFDSRSLHFADEIRRATGGRGVDVVLNSLAGEGITQSVSVLSDYGRFVEIGKMDLDRDFQLGLQPFTRCLSFHAVDLDRMLAQRTGDCGALLRSIQERLATGLLEPLPIQVFPAEECGEAFRTMAAATHTGKLVVDLSHEVRSVATPEGAVRFRADASYLITGGLGGFGLQLAHWMAERGAGHLVLLGRRGLDTPGADRALEWLTAAGAEVQIESCDVSHAADVARVLERIPRDRPLRGVFHAAAVLDDALLKNLDLERYRRAFGPKALGAWNLHVQTLELELDHFMCFSSMASVLGNQGSANYCAANAFVDALAHFRRGSGRPALTVNWGVIADVGMAADEDFYRQNLERNGLLTIHSDHCLELLGLLLASQRVQTTVCPIDFGTWLSLNPAGAGGRLRELRSAQAEAGGGRRTQAAEERALRAELDALEDPSAAAAFIEQHLLDLLAAVFRTSVANIDPTRSLIALGADSLMAIEIKNHLDGLGLGLSVTQLLNQTSARSLAHALLELYGCRAADAANDETVATELAGPSWLIRRIERPHAALRLFCFPYAGGSPRVFHAWAERLPDSIEVVAVNLSGRGSLRSDTDLRDIREAAAALVPELRALLDRPFALFGHCMGAIVAYEVAKLLEREHQQVARQLFVSGCMAPHLYNSPLVHEQPDDAFLDVLRLISFSGTRALLDDADLRRELFPVLRDDFRLVAHYGDTLQIDHELATPITGIAAASDLFAAPKAMQAWGAYTRSGYRLARLPGDHYFVESDQDAVLGAVADVLAETDAALASEVLSVPRDHLGWVEPPSARAVPLELYAAPGDRERSTVACDARPVRVVCFAPAGLDAAHLHLPETSEDGIRYEVAAIDSVRADGGVVTVEQRVEQLYAGLEDRPHERTVFYGYCVGGIVAYELALRLQRAGRVLPERLLVVGAVAPHLYVAPDAHSLPLEKLLELLEVVRFPLAKELAADPEAHAREIARVRSDLGAMALYDPRPAERLHVAISVVSLRHDLWSYPLRGDSWQAYSWFPCDVTVWNGDHYAALRSPERVHELLKQGLAGGSSAAVEADAEPSRRHHARSL